MKKLILFAVAILTSAGISHAQEEGDFEITGSLNYQHFFLNNDAGAIKYSGGFVMQFGTDYYIGKSLYAGGSLGFSLGVVTSEYYDIESWAEIYDIRLPLHVGLANSSRKFKLETGPFIDFSVGGKTEVTSDSDSSEKIVTKLKDMDVDRVSLGWSVGARLFKHLKVNYGIKLTDSAYGKGGKAHLITVGWDF